MPEEHSSRAVLEDLFGRIGVAAGDRGALTLIARRASDGSWVLECASLVFGPPTMSSRSWPQWARIDRPNSRHLDLGVYRVREGDWRSFDRIDGDYRYVRFSMNLGVAIDWLARATSTGELRMRGGDPVAGVLTAPEGVISVFQNVASPAAQLVAMAQRPCTGWFHPLTPTSEADLLPEWRPTKGAPPFNASLTLLGIVPKPLWGPPTPRGLFVGRLRRRAWITDIRGSQPDFATFDVGIRIEPDRTSLWELAIDLEETTIGGDLLMARRLRLADVALPEHGTRDVTVRLPTIRRKVTRRLRLFELDGRLLDAADNVHLAEAVSISVSAIGGKGASTSTIGNASMPTLAERLGALDQLEREYRDLLQTGLPGRIVGRGDDGKKLLAGRLAAARGELLVFDPYIGKDPSSWDVLRKVTVPVRVITGVNRPLPATLKRRSPAVAVRYWAVSPRPPFHDRAYLWRGGGLTVGTSPNGLGSRLSLIDLLEPAVVEGLTALFNSWWSSNGVRAV